MRLPQTIKAMKECHETDHRLPDAATESRAHGYHGRTTLGDTGSMIEALKKESSWHAFALLTLLALALRATVFFGYMKDQERYYQPDTRDYSYCSQLLSQGQGLRVPPTMEPIFLRVPGYPLFISGIRALFQSKYTPQSVTLITLFIQIILCSLLPFFAWIITRTITQSGMLAWIIGGITTVHVGLVLSSCHLQTDGFALIFLWPFFIFLYRSVLRTTDSFDWYNAIGAAIFLGAYTWIRPMGQQIFLFAIIILLIAQTSWRIKCKRILLFSLFFLLILTPWCVRNYKLTDSWFFCDLTGVNLISFCAPKVITRSTNLTFVKASGLLNHAVFEYIVNQRKKLPPGKYISREQVCSTVGWRFIKDHPLLFAYDCLVQALKTAFEPFSMQLVHLHRKTHTYDAPEESLLQNIKDCLYHRPLPLISRMLAWLELLFIAIEWLGVFAGFFTFICMPLIRKKAHRFTLPWLYTGIMVAGIFSLCGAFGYARLRLPVEVLLCILSVLFWYAFVWQKGRLSTC